MLKSSFSFSKFIVIGFIISLFINFSAGQVPSFNSIHFWLFTMQLRLIRTNSVSFNSSSNFSKVLPDTVNLSLLQKTSKYAPSALITNMSSKSNFLNVFLPVFYVMNFLFSITFNFIQTPIFYHILHYIYIYFNALRLILPITLQT